MIALDPARLEARLRRLAFLVPWVSLALGVSAAIWMERTPGRAVVVAAGSAFGWLALVGLAILDRIEHPRRSARLLAVARWSAGALTVGALQQSLFFSIPFYVRASDGSPQHVIFVATLVIAALATLWDPLVDRLMARAITAIPLQAVATFAGLNAVLPILGLSNRAGLIGGAIGAVLGIPLFAVLVPTGIDRRRLAGFVVAALAVPALLLLRPVRALVPAAPLRFVAGAIGTRLEGREPADPASVLPTAPEQLVCATAVEAPRGLRDRLEHVWLHGGDVVDRIPLEVRGGREQGFRTFSVKKHLGVRPEGTWTCAVETVSGQRLGSVRVVIQSPRS